MQLPPATGSLHPIAIEVGCFSVTRIAIFGISLRAAEAVTVVPLGRPSDRHADSPRSTKKSPSDGKKLRPYLSVVKERPRFVSFLAAQWNILDGSRVAVHNLFRWEPVDFFVSVIIHVGITDVHRAHIRILR